MFEKTVKLEWTLGLFQSPVYFFLLALGMVIHLCIIWEIQSAPPCREGAKHQMLRHNLGRRTCWGAALHSISPGTLHLLFISANESRK